MGLGLLATGIGLIFAIASLGDKIKDINKEIREYENTFMKRLGTDWLTLRPLLKTESNPDEKLDSVGLLLAVDKFDVSALKLFEKLNALREKLERIHSGNYNSFIFLAASLFLGIWFDFIVPADYKFNLIGVYLSKEVIVLIVVSIVCFYIVKRLVRTKKKEDQYRKLLYEIGNKV